MGSTLHIGVRICSKFTQHVENVIEEDDTVSSNNLKKNTQVAEFTIFIILVWTSYGLVEFFFYLCNVIKSFTSIITNSILMVNESFEYRLNNKLSRIRDKTS